MAKQTFAAMHKTISSGLVCACHDLSEGGLAVAAAEMAFAGNIGLDISLKTVPADKEASDIVRLFSESNTRFLCEVRAEDAYAFEEILAGIPCAAIGKTTSGDWLTITSTSGTVVVDAPLAKLKKTWQTPLAW